MNSIAERTDLDRTESSVTDNSGKAQLGTLLRDINSLESIVDGWEEQQRRTIDALRRADDELHREAFTRLIAEFRQSPAAMDALKNAVSDEVVYSVLRHHQLVKPTLNERLEQALDSVRPYLASHGGNVELDEIVSQDTVSIRLLGACDGCPASGLTLSEGVEKAIKEYCPEIVHINKAKGGLTASPSQAEPLNFVSPFANSNDDGWEFVSLLEEIPQRGIKVVAVDANELILSRIDSQVTCFQNACAHLGMPLDMGEVKDGVLTCPHHAFKYSLSSGECLTVPEVQLQTHAVRVTGDRVEVKLL